MRRKVRKPPPNRLLFWRFCERSAINSKNRAKRLGVPHTINAYLIDELLTDQNWCCAISGVKLVPPEPGGSAVIKAKAWAPSIDRITPALGYVPGNVRVVCCIVNWAMNAWGPEPLWQLVEAMAGSRHPGIARAMLRFGTRREQPEPDTTSIAPNGGLTH